MRRSSRLFPFFARNWASKNLSKRPGRTCVSASVSPGSHGSHIKWLPAPAESIGTACPPRPLAERFASFNPWFAVAASALPSSNAPARARKCGIEMPTGHFNVRNLVSPHAHASRYLKIAYGVCLDGRAAPVDSALAEQHLMCCSSRAGPDRAGDACPSKQTVGERQLIR